MTAQTPAPSELFATEREWLCAQPRMSPWADGERRLTDELTRLARQHTSSVGVTWPDPPRGEEQPVAYIAPLWKCWAYHWGQAVADRLKPVDGWELAHELSNSPRWGGDVFHGVILARAMLFGHNSALRAFDDEHLLPTARRCEPGARYTPGDMPDWWPNLVDRLVGATRPPGALAGYSGRSGLGAYVLKVALNERRGMTRSAFHRKAVSFDDTAVGTAAQLDFLSDECAELLSGRLAAAFATLTDEEQLLLKWSYKDRLEGQHVADLLGVHPGTISRRKKDGLARFRAAVDRLCGRGSAADEGVDHLLGDGRGRQLSDVLLDALTRGGRT